ncbi:50S ribosome-binding GTPase, partial [bacterium]|nr:50S ribosome-binding GTPase [bacterium]
NCDPGTDGEQKRLKFELKLLADVGLIGLPNAGKSTLISVISSARPKIADYPFTTKVPNLGVVSQGYGRSFTVADIPGLIEHASKGAGLGFQFLKHVERTRVLVHLLDLQDAANPDPIHNYEVIKNELGSYHKELLDKPEIVVLTKIDLPEAFEKVDEVKKIFKEKGLEVIPISAVAHKGTALLINKIFEIFNK